MLTYPFLHCKVLSEQSMNHRIVARRRSGFVWEHRAICRVILRYVGPVKPIVESNSLRRQNVKNHSAPFVTTEKVVFHVTFFILRLYTNVVIEGVNPLEESAKFHSCFPPKLLDFAYFLHKSGDLFGIKNHGDGHCRACHLQAKTIPALSPAN